MGDGFIILMKRADTGRPKAESLATSQPGVRLASIWFMFTELSLHLPVLAPVVLAMTSAIIATVVEQAFRSATLAREGNAFAGAARLPVVRETSASHQSGWRGQHVS